MTNHVQTPAYIILYIMLEPFKEYGKYNHFEKLNRNVVKFRKLVPPPGQWQLTLGGPVLILVAKILKQNS